MNVLMYVPYILCNVKSCKEDNLIKIANFKDENFALLNRMLLVWNTTLQAQNFHTLCFQTS